MKNLIIASPTILAGLVVLVISLREVYRARRMNETHKAESAAPMLAWERELAEREAELIAQLPTRPAELVMKLEMLDEGPLPDLPTAWKQSEPLVSALSQQERSLGGSGLTLTAAKVEPGSVRLTLSPVERTGSAERVRRVAEDWNARGGPLPPGVTAARADVLAA